MCLKIKYIFNYSRYNKDTRKEKFGGAKLSALGERLAWFRDNLLGVVDELKPGKKDWDWNTLFSRRRYKFQ